ncbi:histidine kinase [Natrialba hulunbeirensis JCM 10989]|uniref:histidine kinase n=1 Tax=Natrialba hulunbeirensis JCM 10989 TaxID=1227493 RepID=M0A6H6_9EURY|nr:ATP-binding protein [Natrialba hulunbeirensis]ELY92933.1 histidine kinase [Natrialba hulunbeirensis JCM 10989]
MSSNTSTAGTQTNTIQLLINEEGNRAAIRKLLEDHYEVRTTQSIGQADLYLVDDHSFPDYHAALEERVAESEPVFCPVVLIRRADSNPQITLPDVDERVTPSLIDDIIDAPMDRTLLFRRLNSLLVRREQSKDLLHYISQLEASNQSLEQFAYAASHDLQEPLRMVSSYLQLIEQRYSDGFDEDGEEFLEFAIDGADRMRSMIDALLEYSRIDTEGDPLTPTELDDVLVDVRQDLQVMIEEHDARIESESLPTVAGDADQLRQLFQNLLSNAIEYSGDEQPAITITAEQRGIEWEISVHDRGIGIKADDQERIFEVFQRLHSHEERSGTGIGLALCKRIVERHDGQIWVESEPGEGATFSFTLPVETTHERDGREEQRGTDGQGNHDSQDDQDGKTEREQAV